MAECLKCGLCCNVEIQLIQNGLTFFNPYPFYTCLKLDLETGKCKDYDNRPEACRKYDCNGNPKPMRLVIEGVTKDEGLIIKPSECGVGVLEQR